MDKNEQDIKKDQSVVAKRESNHFISILMKIVKINRVFALAPFVIKTEKQEKHYVAISPTYTIISYLIVIPAYLSLAYMAAHTIRVSYNHYSIYYACGRLFLTALTNFSCVRNRHIILEAINRVADLGVRISNKWVFMQIVMCMIVVIMTAIGKYQQNMWLLEGTVAALNNILPTAVFIGICVQYGCQVVAVRLAIEKLNSKIVEIAYDDVHSEEVTLRPIIKKYRDIYNVCSVLNAAYGSPMFFVTSNIFLEATFGIFFVFTTMEYMAIGGKIYIVVWLVFHTLPSLGLLYVCQLTENLVVSTIITYAVILLQNTKSA